VVSAGLFPDEAPPTAAATYVPVDSYAEQSVIATLLTSPETFFEISQRITAADFGVPPLAQIYRAIVTCEAAGRPFDQITVADELIRAQALDGVGGREALHRLVNLAVEVDNVAAHVDIVVEKSLRRRIITAGRKMVAEAMQPAGTGADVLAGAETTVFELGKPTSQSSMIGMAEAVRALTDSLARSKHQKLVGHSTGFPRLDELTGGLQSGQLIIVAARPGAGKTTFALQLARQIAEASGLLVPFLSYEMSHDELTLKLLSNALEYDQLRLRTGDLPAGMERQLAREAESLADVPMLLDDNPPETIGGVRTAMRALARRGQIGAIVIDYLQLMSADTRFKDSNRTQEVSDISRGLKRLADELKVPVVALSQLNRTLEARPNKRPILSDLRESGSLEQDANLVCFLYRESLYDKTADPNFAELSIGKQRNGPVGDTIYLEFLGSAGGKFKPTDRIPDYATAGAGAAPAAPGASAFGGFGSGTFGFGTDSAF
jgi:replicative DNA helicase